MPGLYTCDESHCSPIRIHSDLKPHFFRTPRTPSTASSAYLSVPPSRDLHPTTHISRKRSRHDSADLSFGLSASGSRWSNVSSVQASKANSPEVISPAPFVNTKYRLAGGLDTPTASAALSHDQATYDGHSPDQAYRRGRERGWSNTRIATSESYFPHFSSALAKDGNGRKRDPSSTPPTGWGKAVVTAFGDVAGKVWEFCRAGAFRGFYAGGGQGYTMTPPTPSYESDSVQSSTYLDETAGTSTCTTPFTSINLPGDFPDSEFIPDYLSHDYTSPSRPTKRLHLDNDDPSAPWVLVTSNSTPRLSREPSPSRIPIRKSKIQPASSPSPRHRPTLIPVRSNTTLSNGDYPNARSASSASIRSPLTTPTRMNHLHYPHALTTWTATSPTKPSLSPDALHFQAEIRRRDEEGDRELAKLNRRMKNLIREGKEALGTRVEVTNVNNGGVEDEGFVDCDGESRRNGGGSGIGKGRSVLLTR